MLYFNFIKELVELSIFVTTKELSFEEQLNIKGPSGFIYLSITASSMIEFELTTKDLVNSPVLTLISFMFPFLVAAYIYYGFKIHGCN